MNLREFTIGALSSLVVTVFGGVAVFYATKEPDDKKNELVLYSLNQPASFTGGTQDLAFSTLEVRNEGGVASKKLYIQVALKTAEIRDVALTQAGLRPVVSKEQKPKSLLLAYDGLLPKEKLTVSMLLSAAERPSVSVRTDASLGIERAVEADQPATIRDKINKVAALLVPATGLLGAAFALFFTLLAKRHALLDSIPNRNDAGFLLLHAGAIADAEAVLSDAVRSGRGDVYTLSNLAAAKAAAGDVVTAKKLVKAALFRDRNGHARAVLLFNEALIALLEGDRTTTLAKLTAASRISPAAVRDYFDQSVHFDAVRGDAEFSRLFPVVSA